MLQDEATNKTYTKMKKIILIIMPLALVFAAFVFHSCEKEEVVSKNDSISPSEDGGYSVNNGILVFNTLEAFDKTIDGIANLSDEDRLIWEETVGFKSQRRIVSEIIKAENEHDELCASKYNDKNIDSIDESVFHSSVYNKYLNKGVISIINEGTDDEYWDYSVFSISFIDFINEDGLYVIGDTLYQVTDKYFKSLKYNNFTKVELLMNTSETIETEDILVQNKNNTLKTYNGCPGYIGVVAGNNKYSWKSSGGGKKREKRIRLRLFLDVKYYISSNTRPGYQFYHEVYVQCQERNWRRKWKYKATKIWVNGAWDINVFSNKQLYSNSWSKQCNASYLKASINPNTGSSAPYRSYFIVYCSDPSPYNNYEKYYPPKFTSYNWNVTRNGGSSGLKQYLTK